MRRRYKTIRFSSLLFFPHGKTAEYTSCLKSFHGNVGVGNNKKENEPQIKKLGAKKKKLMSERKLW